MNELKRVRITALLHPMDPLPHKQMRWDIEAFNQSWQQNRVLLQM